MSLTYHFFCSFSAITRSLDFDLCSRKKSFASCCNRLTWKTKWILTISRSSSCTIKELRKILLTRYKSIFRSFSLTVRRAISIFRVLSHIRSSTRYENRNDDYHSRLLCKKLNLSIFRLEDEYRCSAFYSRTNEL
jgi:hypothetical protein